jgi:hypothetical protein
MNQTFREEFSRVAPSIHLKRLCSRKRKPQKDQPEMIGARPLLNMTVRENGQVEVVRNGSVTSGNYPTADLKRPSTSQSLVPGEVQQQQQADDEASIELSMDEKCSSL